MVPGFSRAIVNIPTAVAFGRIPNRFPTPETTTVPMRSRMRPLWRTMMWRMRIRSWKREHAEITHERNDHIMHDAEEKPQSMR